MDELGRDWLRTGTLSAEDGSRLVTLIAQLRGIYRRHMAVEDNEVFPVAAAALSAAALREVASEMASR